MVYGDLHIHSCYSNGYFRNYLPPWVASKPEEILKKAKMVGLKVVAITDHDSLEGSRQAQKIAKKFGIIVVPACEVSSQDGHILAYGLKKEIPKKLRAEETIRLIHSQGGLAVAAHPFKRKFLFGNLGLNEKISNLVLNGLLDGLEVANSCNNHLTNLEAERIIPKNSRFARIGGSDSHVLDFIGWGRTIFSNEVRSAKDVLEAIRKKQTGAEIVRHVPIFQVYFASFRDQFRFLLSLNK